MYKYLYFFSTENDNIIYFVFVWLDGKNNMRSKVFSCLAKNFYYEIRTAVRQLFLMGFTNPIFGVEEKSLLRLFELNFTDVKSTAIIEYGYQQIQNEMNFNNSIQEFNELDSLVKKSLTSGSNFSYEDL